MTRMGRMQAARVPVRIGYDHRLRGSWPGPVYLSPEIQGHATPAKRKSVREITSEIERRPIGQPARVWGLVEFRLWG
jgi:hypothetical protein